MMRLIEVAKKNLHAAKETVKRRPYVSLSLFVIIVVVVAALGYARYQHVQAEIAAQQNLFKRIQLGFDHWTSDLSIRLSDLKDNLGGTAEGARNIVGGTWGIIRFLVTAVLDYVGNLHIMVPVTIIYFGVGFFGTLKMRVATLIGALIAFWVSTSIGIVQGSIIGLLAIAGLLLWNKMDPRLLTKIQGLPSKLKDRFEQMRDKSNSLSANETKTVDPTDVA